MTEYLKSKSKNNIKGKENSMDKPNSVERINMNSSKDELHCNHPLPWVGEGSGVGLDGAAPRPLELLAPARDLACAIAAIDHGADAVYIGADRFGARAAAGNTVDDIKKVCEYAHRFGAKVYVTVNTIIYENELEATQELINDLSRIGVDALLVQDMAILEMRRIALKTVGRAPVLHASTQMDNRTIEKVLWLRNIGFTRAVLARELSIEEIRRIHEVVPDIELEVFVHGALCVSISGQCYASQHLFNRSANRGECAQVCRMKYDLIDDNGETIVKDRYLLSMKDLCQIDNLERLADAGASSFKIEGRLKGPDYVKNVVSAYRQKLDDIIARHPNDYRRASWEKVEYGFTPDVNKTFNRGYTEGIADTQETAPRATTPQPTAPPLTPPPPMGGVGYDKPTLTSQKAIPNNSNNSNISASQRNLQTFGCRSNLCTMFTPKALGEFMGTVKEVHFGKNGYIKVKTSHSHATHDGENGTHYCNQTPPISGGGARGGAVRSASARGGATPHVFSNGDGICFIDESHELVGFRVNKVEGDKLYPFHTPQGLKVGMSVYRNSDVAFEKMLKGDNTKRKIIVNMRLSITDKGYRLTLSADLDREKPATAAASIDFEHQRARTPQTSNIIKQLQRLGETIYEAEDISLDNGIEEMFIPSSILADLRRKAVTELNDTLRSLTKDEDVANGTTKDANDQTVGPQTEPKYWTREYREYPYLFNVSNHKAQEFYEKHGLNVSEPAFEVKAPKDKLIMQCRYCIRHELGFCVRRGGKRPTWKEPLTLRLGDGHRFTLEFRCNECQMNIHV